MLLLTDRVGAIIIGQMVLSLTSSCFVVWAVFRAFGKLCIPTAVVMAGFLFSNSVVLYDSSLLSESLFTSSLMCFGALLVLSVRFGEVKRYWILSCVVGFAILVRPAGMFLVGTLVLFFLYLARKRSQILDFLALAIPVAVLLGLTCCYNFWVGNQLSLNPFGTAGFFGATSTFWVEDKTLSEESLSLIRSTQSRISVDDRNIINNDPWHSQRLFDLYCRHYSDSIYGGHSKALGEKYSGNPSAYYGELRKIAFAAISHNPYQYIRFVACSCHQFFIRNPVADFSFYDYLCRNYKTVVLDRSWAKFGDPLPKFFLGEYYDLDCLPNYVVEYSRGESIVKIVPTTAKILHTRIYEIQQSLFRNRLWICAWLAVLFTSMLRWTLSRFVDREAFLIFAISSVPLGAAIVSSISTLGIGRYSTPIEFFYYLSVVLFPIMFFSHDKEPLPVVKCGKGRSL
jgi:hypothetical protein